jgi:hypothetical protein
LMSRVTRIMGAGMAALTFASCGGGGGGGTTDIEAKLSDKGITNPSCSEISAGEAKGQGFSCSGTQQGRDVQIVVTKVGDRLSATVTAGGTIVDFFVLD